jgi:hypothetical protein
MMERGIAVDGDHAVLSEASDPKPPVTVRAVPSEEAGPPGVTTRN